MRLLEKRETPVQNIAFIAVMVAINALASLLSSFVPLSSLFVVVFLPLVSAFAITLLQKRYIILYVISAIGISIIAGLYDPSNTIFYIIPAIISGSVYGMLVERKTPLGWLIFAIALLNMGLNYLALPILKAIYGINFIESGIALLGLSERPNIYNVVPSFIFVLSLIETALSNLVIQFELRKLGKSHTEWEYSWITYSAFGIVCSFLSLSLAFVNIASGMLFLVFSVYFACLSVIGLSIQKRWWLWIVVGGLALISFALNAILTKYYPDGGKLLLLGLYTFSVALPSLLGRILLLKKGKSEIDG